MPQNAITLDTARHPLKWRKALSTAITHGTLAELHEQLCVLEDDPCVLTRRAVVLRRLGRTQEALDLLAPHAEHGICRAQHALNHLAAHSRSGPEEDRNAAVRARAILGDIPEAEMSEHGLETRARWEVAAGIINKRLGYFDNARCCFARGSVLAEMYGDTSFAEQARAEMLDLGQQSSVVPLSGALSTALADGDPLKIEAAALRLAEAAWGEYDERALSKSLPHIPETHPARRAYGGLQPTAHLPEDQQHPIALAARSYHDLQAAMRARDRADHETALILCRDVIERGAPACLAPAARAKALLAHAMAFNIIGAYTGADNALEEATRLTPKDAKVARAVLPAITAEMLLWRSAPSVERLAQSVSGMYNFALELTPEQLGVLGRHLRLYAVHSLAHLNMRMTHPVLAAIMSDGSVTRVTRSKDIHLVTSSIVRDSPQIRRHSSRLTREDGVARIALIRTHVEMLNSVLKTHPVGRVS